MRNIAAVAALWAVAFSSGGNALADDHDNRSNREEQSQRSEREDHHEGEMRSSERENDRKASERHGEGDRASTDDRRDERGAGPEHSFHRGAKLPDRDHDRRYVVEDWRGHHLSEPPHGYHWVQAGSDYVLVAIATGIILQLLLSN